MTKRASKIAAAVLFVIILGLSSNGYAETKEGFSYTLDGNNNAVITGYAATPYGVIIIPQQIDGHTVTAIGDDAFYHCAYLTRVILPDTITSIGSFAFCRCSALTSINLPYGITIISKDAFQGCRSLKSIEIPKSVKSIGDSAFDNCSSLTSITIPSSVVNIGNRAFSGCSLLANIQLSSEITKINAYMFSNCRSLKSIIISFKVTVIDTCAFMGCNSLSSVIVPPSVTFIHRSAFDDCYDVVLFVAENSYAHQWAISNNVAFKLNTVAINSITVKYTAREAGEPNRYYATAQTFSIRAVTSQLGYVRFLFNVSCYLCAFSSHISCFCPFNSCIFSQSVLC